jgi:hypothetical protein
MAGSGSIATAYVDIVAKYGTLRPDIVKAGTEAGQAGGEATSQGLAQGITSSKAHRTAAASEGKATGEAFGKNATDSMNRLWNVAKGAAIGLAVRSAINAASDLNETISLGKTVFGDNAGAIEAWAKTADKNLGMSRKAAEDSAIQFANLLQNLGYTGQAAIAASKNLVQLGGDLASAFNTAPADAVAAIGSAMRGETEPIRRYGVVMNEAALKTQALKMGLDVSGPTLDANVRAQAALALITQQTTNAQGDFARTSDQAANSARIQKAELENARAELGANFLPIYTTAVQVVGQLASAFGALPGPVQVAVVALGTMIALRGPLIALGQTVAGVFSAEAVGGLAAFGTGLGVIVGVVGIAAAAYAIFGKKHDEVGESAKKMVDNMKAATAEITNESAAASTGAELNAKFGASLEKAASQVLVDRLTKSKDLLKGIIDLGTSMQGITEGIFKQGNAQEYLESVRRKAIESGAIQLKAMSGTEAQAKALTEQWIKEGGSLDELRASHNNLHVSMDGTKQDVVKLIGTLEQQAAAYGKTKDQMILLAEAGDLETARTLKSGDAWNELTNAQQASINAQLVLAAQREADAASTKTQTDNIKDQQEALKLSAAAEEGRVKAAQQAARDIIEAYKGISDGLKGDIDAQTAADKAQRDWIDVVPAYIKTLKGIKDSHGDIATKTLDSKIATDEFKQKVIDTSEKLAALAGKPGSEAFFDAQVQAMLTLRDQAAVIAPEIVGVIDAMIAEMEARAGVIAFKYGWTVESASGTLNVKPNASGGLSVRKLTSSDSGGHLSAGQPTLVGRGAQPELFVPDVAGSMFPAGTYGVTSGQSVVIDASINVAGHVYGVDDLNALLDAHTVSLTRAILAGTGRRG